MRKIILILQIVVFASVLYAVPKTQTRLKTENKNLINRIEGQIWDPYRKPVSDVYVELLNELYSSISRVRTDSSGRFSFVGVSSGHFNIKVLTVGTNYLEYTEGVDVVNVFQGSSDSVYVNVYLKFDPRRVNSGITGVTDTIFVQEIPAEAEKLYKKGVKLLDGRTDIGFSEIDAALKIFPNYFNALNTMGKQYTQRKDFQKALPYLVKSIDVNNRSYSSFYALAYCSYKLNFLKEAIDAAKAATIIQPKSINALLLYGTILRINGNFKDAEKPLRTASDISKDDPVAEIHWQLALLYNRLFRDKEAVAELEKYLKLMPDAPNKKEIEDLIIKLKSTENYKKGI
jgi:hypothetical protein